MNRRQRRKQRGRRGARWRAERDLGTPTVAGLAAALAKATPTDASATRDIACAPRHRYRTRLAADGEWVLDQSLRDLLHLDD